MKHFFGKIFNWRNLKIAAYAVAAFAVFLVALNYGLEKYNQSKQWQEIKKSAEAFQKAEQELYQKMMADTYGGKTPQETLELFIAAVEKGDYELASRYFVKSKQEEELRALQAAEKADIDNVIKLMKETENDSGSYSADRKTFIVRKPILTEYTFYPSGIWKIVEI